MCSPCSRAGLVRNDDQRLRWSAWVWSPPPESNRRPHPYHGTTRNRCADRRIPRSRPTVGAKVIGSLSAQLCALFKPCANRRWSKPSSRSEILNSVERPRWIIARVHATLVMVAFDVVDQFISPLQHLAARRALRSGAVAPADPALVAALPGRAQASGSDTKPQGAGTSPSAMTELKLG